MNHKLKLQIRSKMKTIIYLAIIVAVAGIGFSILKAMSKNKTRIALSKLSDEEKATKNIHDIKVKKSNGEVIQLSDYKGKVLLIVNVASYCGYTNQYEGLEEIYRKYKSQGFEILAFPCNDFGSQEPGTNEEIANFCTSKYDVTFQLFDKITMKGENRSELYARLTSNVPTGIDGVKWNFEKFLIGKNGDILSRFKSNIKPTSNEVVTAIEAELRM